MSDLFNFIGGACAVFACLQAGLQAGLLAVSDDGPDKVYGRIYAAATAIFLAFGAVLSFRDLFSQ